MTENGIFSSVQTTQMLEASCLFSFKSILLHVPRENANLSNEQCVC